MNQHRLLLRLKVLCDAQAVYQQNLQRNEAFGDGAATRAVNEMYLEEVVLWQKEIMEVLNASENS